jgi:type I restriction enzyme S subunit
LAQNDTRDVGVLPEGWAEVPVSQVGELLRGVSYKKAVARETPAEDYLPILRATNIQDERLILDSELVYVPEKYVKLEQILEPGDVVICMSSGSKHLVGKTAQLTQVWDGSFGAFCAALRFNPALDQRFAGYFFGSPGYRSLIRERSSGVNINNLRRSDIETLIFPIPPLAEQHRIVDEIETQFTRLEVGVAALKRAQANLRRYKASVLKAACEGRLVPTEAELARAEGRDYEPAEVLLQRILAERRARWEAENPGKKYKEPASPNTADLPEVPEGWVWARVADVGEVETGTTPRKSIPEYYGKDYPFYKPTDLDSGYYTREAREYLSKLGMKQARSLPAKSTLVTCIGATIGKTGFIRTVGASNQQINAIVPEDGIVPELIYFVCISPQFQKSIADNASATTLPILNKSRLMRLVLPLPPRAEQSRIVAEVERRLSVVGELEEQVETALRRADRLRQAILNHAFEGRLVPQDPEDAPASALLARIKAEKAP